MATFNYAKIAGRAATLVARFGRSVTLRRLNTTPPNPAEPWVPPADPRASAVTLAVTAAFVHPTSLTDFGVDIRLIDWVPRAEQVALVAGSALLNEYSELVDSDASVWRIVGVQPLKPGPTLLLQGLGVAR